MVDLSRLMVVLVVTGALYFAAAAFLLHLAARWGWRRLMVRPETAPATAPRRMVRIGRWVRASVLALAAAGLLCAAYARLIEPRWPAVEHVRIVTTKLPAGARSVRLVLLADLHSDPEARLEPQLPGLVAELKPDAIIFAGDAINCAAGLPHFRECMARLAALAPAYAVRGNWETWWFPQVDLYRGTGVRLLDGEAASLPAAGGRIWVAGSGVDHEENIPAALAEVPRGSFAVLVHHFPEAAAAAIRTGADLAVSGDTHGGQVRLPLVGPLVRLSRFGSYHDVGLHRLGAGWLYVSRGLGTEGGRAPRVRFLCRPEITLIEIAAEGK
jgi:hypothetical protein